MPKFDVDYNDLLFIKMQHEYIVFLDDLKELPTTEILERSYEKTVKQELLYMCEETELPQEQAKALYEMKKPLDGIYQDWLKSDKHIRESLDGAFSNTANKEIESANNTLKDKPILPNQIPSLSGMTQSH